MSTPLPNKMSWPVTATEYIPPPHLGAHIWTKSTGGNDAAMWVQPGYFDTDAGSFVTIGDAVAVVYNTVQGSNTYNCNGVATLAYPSGWVVKATAAVTDGTNTYASGDTVKTWTYSESVDFYVYATT